MDIPIGKIFPNPEQPRLSMDAAALDELAASIRQYGVIQPVVVEQYNGVYVLVDGHRRVEAAKRAGLSEIPAHVREGQAGLTDRLLMALVANVQREAMNPLDEGKAYRRLMDEFGLKAAGIAQMVGKSLYYVRTLIDLTDSDPAYQQAVADGKLRADSTLISDLKRLPAEMNGKIIGYAVESGHTTATVTRAARQARRMHEAAMLERQKDANGEHHQDIPGMKHGLGRTHKNFDRPAWDAMAQARVVPAWESVRLAAKMTCDVCPLREDASEVTCRDCALPQFIAHMARIVKAEATARAGSLPMAPRPASTPAASGKSGKSSNRVYGGRA